MNNEHDAAFDAQQAHGGRRRRSLIAVLVLGLAVFLAPAHSDLCSNYTNPAYELVPDSYPEAFFDGCMDYPEEYCYSCTASAPPEPGDSTTDYYHCAEDQPGTWGSCWRYESWYELQLELSNRVKHQF